MLYRAALVSTSDQYNDCSINSKLDDAGVLLESHPVIHQHITLGCPCAGCAVDDSDWGLPVRRLNTQSQRVLNSSEMTQNI